VIEGKAVFAGPERRACVRLESRKEFIYLDLGNKDWQVVRIGESGWKIVGKPLVRFRRPSSMQPLPVPIANGNIEELRELLNVCDDGWVLILAWLIAAYRPVGPYPILALHGEQGSAKTTTARMLRKLVDPNTAPLRCEPSGPRDLMIAANNGWIVALDNLSRIPGWLSDALCRLSTGGGFATRTLYANDEETIFDATRPIILTGIEELASRSDLLDRTIILQLPRIPDSKRRTEAEHWKAFDDAHGRILGAILNAVCKAIRNLPTIELEQLPRMADFALWAVAAETGFGLKSGSFEAAYERNRNAVNDITLESNPVGKYILQLTKSSNWKGTASELLKRLTSLEEAYGESREKSWPRTPRAISGLLKRLAPNLRRAGVDVEFSRDTDRSRRRLICLTRIEGSSSVRTVRHKNCNAGTSDVAVGADAKLDPRSKGKRKKTPGEKLAERMKQMNPKHEDVIKPVQKNCKRKKK
jgi:hypothetical protein